MCTRMPTMERHQEVAVLGSHLSATYGTLRKGPSFSSAVSPPDGVWLAPSAAWKDPSATAAQTALSRKFEKSHGGGVKREGEGGEGRAVA